MLAKIADVPVCTGFAPKVAGLKPGRSKLGEKLIDRFGCRSRDIGNRTPIQHQYRVDVDAARQLVNGKHFFEILGRPVLTHAKNYLGIFFAPSV